MENSSAFDWDGARSVPDRKGVTYVRSKVSNRWVPVNTFDTDTAMQAAKPVEARDDGVHLTDYFKSVMGGGAGLVAGAGWLAKKVPLMESFGQAIEQVGNDAVSYWDESLSEGAKTELAKQFVQKNADGEYEWGDAGVQTALLTGTRSLPSMAGGLGVGAGLAKVMQVFANPVGRSALVASIQAGKGAAAGSAAAVRAAQAIKKLKLVDTMLAATGFGAGEALVAAPDAGAAVERQVMQMSLEKLSQSERWREVYDSAEDMEEAARIKYATETIAKEASSQAGWQSGLTTFLLGGGAGAYYGRLLNRGAAAKLADTFSKFEKTTMGRVAAGAAVEGAQEFAQSGAQQYAQNKAVIDWADPSIDPFDQVLEQAVGGAVVGAPLGAGFSALQRKEQEDDFQPVLDRALDASFDPDRKMLTGPAPDADFVVGEEGTARRPGEAVEYPALPAPTPSDTMVVDGQGRAVRPTQAQMEQARARGESMAGEVTDEQQAAGSNPGRTMRALPAPENTNTLAVDSGGVARPQTKGERGMAEARVAETQDQQREAGKLGRQETGTNPGRAMPMRIKAAVGEVEPAAHSDGETVGVRYAVVELSDLQTSNDHQTGLKNKKYPQDLQPRERAPGDIRANAASPAATFKADSLLQGGTTGQGAPIIGQDGFVESGNGRVMNLKAMADRGALDEYNQKVAARAAEVGIDPQAIGKFRQPVLVRVRQQYMDAAERKDFAVRANAEVGGATVDEETVSKLEEARQFIGGTIAGGGAKITPDDIYEAGGRSFAEGQKLRDQNSSLPHLGNQEWFRRPDQDLTAEQANAAIDKAKAGKKLGAREQRFIEYALETIDKGRTDGAENFNAGQDADEQRRTTSEAASLIESAPTAEDLDWYADALAREEQEAEDEIDRIAQRELEGEGDEESGRPEEAAAEGAQGGNRAPEEGGGEAPRGADSEDLTLTAPAAPAARAPEKTSSTPDLFGDDTRAAQQLADEQRRRDAERNTGQESVETGDAGDMFSQARQQRDLTDTPTPPKPAMGQQEFALRKRLAVLDRLRACVNG